MDFFNPDHVSTISLDTQGDPKYTQLSKKGNSYQIKSNPIKQQKVKSWIHGRKYLTILLLVPLLAMCIFSIAAFRDGTPGFRVDKTQHGLYVSKVIARNNPVQPGDLIVKINGVPYTRILGLLILGSSQNDQQTRHTITLERNGQEITFTSMSIPVTWPDYLAIAWPHLLLISVFLLLACLALFLADPDQPAGIFFFLLCWFATTIATTLPSHFGLLDPRTISLSFLGITFSNWLAFGGLAHFTCRFPRERDFCRTTPLLAPMLYLIPPFIVLAAALFTAGFTDAFFSELQRFRNIGLPVVIIGSFIKHFVDLRHLRSPSSRNQVKLTLNAYWLTFAPYLAFYLLPNLIFDKPMISFRIVLLTAIILPTAYLIALLRYRLLGVDRLISRTVAYFIVIFFLAVTYTALLAILKRWFFGRQIFSEKLFLIFLLILALGINPLINWTQRLVDRFFFRYRPSDNAMLFDFSKKLASTLLFSELVSLITNELPRQMQITRSALLLLDEKYSRLYPEHLRIGSSPWPDSQLVKRFSDGEQAIFCHEEQDDPQLNAELSQLLSAGYVLALPLWSSSLLTGIVLLGPRKDERLFREQDTRLLATMTNQISIALTNSLHYTSLAESKEQLETLFSKLVQTEKMAALGEMSVTLAHEIRNPLGIIRSSAQYLAEETRSAEITQEMLRYILDEVDNLNMVITNILGLAKFKNPDFQPVNLEHELHALCDKWRESDDHNQNISIRCTVTRRMPVLYADFGQIRQVLLNLFLNSEEALAGDGTISLSAEKQDDFVLIRMQDDGPGIAEENKDELFGKFFTTKKDGLGLGLTVCKQIIEAHYGTITIDNRAQGGAEALIRMPFQPMMAPGTEQQK